MAPKPKMFKAGVVDNETPFVKSTPDSDAETSRVESASARRKRNKAVAENLAATRSMHEGKYDVRIAEIKKITNGARAPHLAFLASCPPGTQAVGGAASCRAKRPPL